MNINNLNNVIMRRSTKLVIAAACFFAALTMSNVSNAQLKDTVQQKNKQIIDLSKSSGAKISGVLVYNKDQIIQKKDSVQAGTELRFVVYWTEKSNYSKIVFTDPVKYEPTPEEIKNRQFSFTVKPERTTTYKYTIFYKNSAKKPLLWQRKINVVDKNGKEIK